MITTKCLIRFTTHSAVITCDDTGTIHVFKYTDSQCDFDVFDTDTQFEAGDYILEPVTNGHYYISFPDEADPHSSSCNQGAETSPQNPLCQAGVTLCG